MTTYVPQAHTHVTIRHPDKQVDRDDYRHPFRIILHVGEYVWVPMSYAHVRSADMLLVGDGRSPGYDGDGNCIVSVPTKYVTAYHDEEVAAQIEQAIDCDDTLMGYAR